MINISSDAIEEYYNGTTPHQMAVEFEGMKTPREEWNVYESDGFDLDWNVVEWMRDGEYKHRLTFAMSREADDVIMPKYNKDGSNIGMCWLSFDIYPMISLSSNFDYIKINYTYFANGSSQGYSDSWYSSSADKDAIRNASKLAPFRVRIPIDRNDANVGSFWVFAKDASGNNLQCRFGYRRYAVNYAQPQEGTVNTPKNIPYSPSCLVDGQLPKEYLYIDNDHIEKEQAEMTESLCSGDNLIFGSAEASHFRIGLIDTNEDFKDRYFRPYIIKTTDDAWQYNYDIVNWSAIDTSGVRGFSDTTSRMAAQISFLGSNSLNEWLPYRSTSVGIEFGIKFRFKLVNYTSSVKPEYIRIRFGYYPPSALPDKKNYRVWMWSFRLADVGVMSDFFKCQMFVGHNDTTELNRIGEFRDIAFELLDANKQTMGSVAGNYTYEFEYTNLILYLHQYVKTNTPFKDEEQYVAKGYNVLSILQDKGSIPLGRYKSSDVSKTMNRSLVRKSVQGYDQLYDLDANAADWYSFYMYGINSYQYSSQYGFEFARQIYSTYFNLAQQLGLERINPDQDELIVSYSESEGTAASRFASDMSLQFKDNNGNLNYYLHYTSYTIEDADSACLYRVKAELAEYMTDASVIKDTRYFPQFFTQWNDPYGRGFCKHASICVIEYNEDGIAFNKYLVDSNDYFKISSECKKLKIYIPYGWNSSATASSGMKKHMDYVWIFKLYKPFMLTNASTRLVYYKYFRTAGANDIFACDSSVSAREAIRSILEPTGCFYHIDRYGNTCFKYCTKSGLYPSNTLLPADNLYPRSGTDGQTLSMGRYLSFQADDYMVQDIGRIQILKNTFSSESQSVCQWEYVGNAKKLNTYVIDSNIFYCNEDMEYEYDAMPEVSQMLENLYKVISNMGYVPNITVARGMPWVEVGDRIGLLTDNGGIESFVFRRTFNGIQQPRDTFESHGDEKTEAIKNYAYRMF